MFDVDKSLLIKLIQVVLGRPMGRLAGLMASCRDCLAGVESGSRSRCPSQFSLRLLIVRLHFSALVIVMSLSLQIRRGQCMSSVFLRSLR